jgi:trimethylamine--corrinoid protein Co-methyltransferase
MASETPPLQPIRPTYHVRILSDGQLDQLTGGTLEILDEVGVHCPSEKARNIYAAHGARVDFEKQFVRIPPDVVMANMRRAPRYYRMGARLPGFDLTLDGTAMFCATDGCGIETIDFTTRQRRASTKDDVARMARISDYLSSLGFYWPIVSAQDFPETAPLHELDAAFNNTVKHIQSETIMGEATARFAVEMARVIAGDEATLRARPPLSLLVCCIAPLAQDKDGLESALYFAGAGLPVGFMSMATTGSTAPATLAGTAIVADAEIISALVLIQMAYPGAPVFHSFLPGVMHPRTGGYLSSSREGSLFYPIGTELAHRWGVPTLAGIFGTDAPVPGWESASEAASSLMLCALTGSETGSGLGLLESCTLLYPESIVLDDDLYHRVRVEAAGLEVNRESLALDVIKDVGPRGFFLKHRHTREKLRQRLYSDLTGQPTADGSLREVVEVARDKVNWILQNHQPQPLETAQQQELDHILAAADHEIGGKI